jgi:hypothetical protein
VAEVTSGRARCHAGGARRHLRPGRLAPTVATAPIIEVSLGLFEGGGGDDLR